MEDRRQKAEDGITAKTPRRKSGIFLTELTGFTTPDGVFYGIPEGFAQRRKMFWTGLTGFTRFFHEEAEGFIWIGSANPDKPLNQFC